MRCYPHFTLAMGSSPGFASTAGDSGALFGLAFAAGAALRRALPSPPTVTRWLIKQKARRHPEQHPRALPRLRPFVGARFQVLFHSPLGVLFTFPSRYWCTIGLWGVFSLARWFWQLPAGFPLPRGTQERPRRTLGFRLRGYHPLWLTFPGHSAIPPCRLFVGVLQPRRC